MSNQPTWPDVVTRLARGRDAYTDALVHPLVGMQTDSHYVKAFTKAVAAIEEALAMAARIAPFERPAPAGDEPRYQIRRVDRLSEETARALVARLRSGKEGS